MVLYHLAMPGREAGERAEAVRGGGGEAEAMPPPKVEAARRRLCEA